MEASNKKKMNPNHSDNSDGGSTGDPRDTTHNSLMNKLTRSFSESLLKGTGQVALVRAGLEATVVQGLTNDHSKLRRALQTLKAADQTGVLETISHHLHEANIGIAKLFQKNVTNNIAELIIITHKVKETDINHVLATLINTDAIKEISTKLRVALDKG